MRAVKDKSDQLCTRAEKEIDYNQHAALLLSSAKNDDTHFVSASSRTTRKLCSIELRGSDFELDSPSEVTEYLDYETNSSTTTLVANMTTRGNPNSDSFLPSEYCASLLPEEKYL